MTEEYIYKTKLYGDVIVDKFIEHMPDELKPRKIPNHIYEIVDNSALPFVVFDYGNFVDVYSRIYDNETKLHILNKKVLHTKCKKIFVGYDKYDDALSDLPRDDKLGRGMGNSVLIHTNGRKYIYIGNGIKSFSIKDEILDYTSPIGNNAVPYPFALGKKYTYLLIEMVYVDKMLFTDLNMVYRKYYSLLSDTRKAISHEIKHDLLVGRFGK